MKHTLKPVRACTRAAFTLLEIMLVIIIIVALMSVLIPRINEALIHDSVSLSIFAH